MLCHVMYTKKTKQKKEKKKKNKINNNRYTKMHCFFCFAWHVGERFLGRLLPPCHKRNKTAHEESHDISNNKQHIIRIKLK